MLITYEAMYHHRALFEIIERKKMTGSINMENYVLTLHYGDYEHKLYPQFQLGDGNYSPQIMPDTKRFIGYRPYHIKSWDMAGDKMKFKQLLAANRILHPWGSEDSDLVDNSVVIKRKVTAFGIGMKGPFRSTLEMKLDPEYGEYYEQFISGTIVKIWFWNADAIAAEVIPPASVLGDGRSKISELIAAKADAFNTEIEIETFRLFVEFQGLTLATVLPAGQRCTIDYLYKSKLPSKRGYDARIGADDFFGLESTLAHIGQVAVDNFPETMGDNTVYAIDGVVDRAGQLWVLELNTNPYVHPYVYEPMIESWRLTVS